MEHLLAATPAAAPPPGATLALCLLALAWALGLAVGMVLPDRRAARLTLRRLLLSSRPLALDAAELRKDLSGVVLLDDWPPPVPGAEPALAARHRSRRRLPPPSWQPARACPAQVGPLPTRRRPPAGPPAARRPSPRCRPPPRCPLLPRTTSTPPRWAGTRRARCRGCSLRLLLPLPPPPPGELGSCGRRSRGSSRHPRPEPPPALCVLSGSHAAPAPARPTPRPGPSAWATSTSSGATWMRCSPSTPARPRRRPATRVRRRPRQRAGGAWAGSHALPPLGEPGLAASLIRRRPAACRPRDTPQAGGRCCSASCAAGCTSAPGTGRCPAAAPST
jgi:hypothetical protein